MTGQTQYSRQNTNAPSGVSGGGYRHSIDADGGVANDNSQAGECDSFINNTMMYSTDTPSRDCSIPYALCLLYFLGQCDGNLCIGVYCAYHHQLMSGRHFIGMTNEDRLTSRIVSVSQQQMRGKFMHLVTSIIPLRQSLSYFESWTKDLSIPHEERANITKFFTILCNSESKCIANSAFAFMKQYVNEIAAHYFNMIRSYQNQLTQIKIPINMTTEQEAIFISDSEWFRKVYKSDGVEIIKCNRDNTSAQSADIVIYYIPIMKFNAFDILNFMTYNLEPALNQEGYLPNCELTNTHIVHGTNYGIFNCVESYSTQNKVFGYPPQLNQAINQQITARVANLDVLNLYCVSEPDKSVNYIEAPIALLKTDACAKFELSYIRSVTDTF